MKKVIALSGKQCTGKDVCADILVSYLSNEYKNIEKLPFAKSLKKEFIQNFLPDWTIEELESNKADFRKDLIAFSKQKKEKDPLYFCKKINDSKADLIVISDLRFKNEYLFLLDHYITYFVRVESDLENRQKRGRITCSLDESETELDHQVFDYFLYNNSDKKSLKTHIKMLLLPEILSFF